MQGTLNNIAVSETIIDDLFLEKKKYILRIKFRPQDFVKPTNLSFFMKHLLVFELEEGGSICPSPPQWRSWLRPPALTRGLKVEYDLFPLYWSWDHFSVEKA